MAGSACIDDLRSTFRKFDRPRTHRRRVVLRLDVNVERGDGRCAVAVRHVKREARREVFATVVLEAHFVVVDVLLREGP